ncbi:MAG: hypothetical protein QXF52_09385 [Thermoproteota archaeon]
MLEDPKLVLVEMTKKLKETLEKKGDDPILEGDIGEGYIKLRLNEIKKKLSELLGIPENELAINGPYKRGPDYRVYRGEELIAIIEVKTTRIAKIYQEGECLDKAKEDLKGYLDSNYRNARLGIPIAIYLEDLDKAIETDLKDGIKCTLEDIIKNIVWNPNYEP